MKKFDIRVFMASARREAGEETGAGLTPAAIRHLLGREGEDFVRQAYRQILDRDVDPAGLAGYAPRACSWSGRFIITIALLISPERLLLPSWLRQGIRIAGRPFRKNVSSARPDRPQ